MTPGDLSFFYNSNCKVIGIIGTMRIVGDAYPDPTQWDPESRYFDPKSSREKPRWLLRDVEFVEKFERTVTLDELRSYPDLVGMEVLRKGQRLSVMPVAAHEWKFIQGLDGLRSES
jgi:predicted RNA-binding protein with PUA-like domain